MGFKDISDIEKWPLTHWNDADYVNRTAEWIKNNMMRGDKILTSRPISNKNKNGRHMLVPTLILIDKPLESPFVGVELPFPFAVIGKINSQVEAESLIENSRFVYRIGFN